MAKSDEPTFSKQTVTNVSAGPRVLNSRTGHLLQPNEILEDVEISDAELEVAKAHGHFAFGAKAAKEAAKDDSEGAKPE